MNPYFKESKQYPVSQDYQIIEELGDGGFSVVKKGVSHEDKHEVAVKIIKKKKVGSDDLHREVQIWKLASKNSTRIVELFDIYEDEEHVYLVMELMHGGELFEKIVKMDDYSEKYAATIIKQVLMIVRDLHKVDIVHQDMKPENLLLRDKESPAIKLCDFGLAEIAEDEIELIGLAGSTPYMAPEVVQGGGHSKPVDVYASGVIMYILLCGYPPFEPENGIIELEFPSPEWDEISGVAKGLIQMLLCSNPEQRPTAAEALKHPWFKDVETLKDLSRPLHRTMDTLRRYKEMAGNPSSSMKQYRGRRESVMGIFTDPPPLPEGGRESSTEDKKNKNGFRKESMSESASSVSTVEDIIATFQRELAKTRDKTALVKKETSILRVKLAEQVAIRQEIETRMKWELEIIRKEAEEERRKRKRLQAHLESLKISDSKKGSGAGESSNAGAGAATGAGAGTGNGTGVSEGAGKGVGAGVGAGAAGAAGAAGGPGAGSAAGIMTAGGSSGSGAAGTGTSGTGAVVVKLPLAGMTIAKEGEKVTSPKKKK